MQRSWKEKAALYACVLPALCWVRVNNIGEMVRYGVVVGGKLTPARTSEPIASFYYVAQPSFAGARIIVYVGYIHLIF